MKSKAQKPMLNFENYEDTLKSLQEIRKEYIRNSIKVYLSLIVMAGVYLIYFILIFPFFPDIFVNEQRNGLNNLFMLDQIFVWIFFIFYLSFHFFILSFIRFSPSLIQYLKQEIMNIGFSLKSKYKIGLNFFFFNSFSIFIFLILDLSLIYIENIRFKILAIRFLIIYVFISITLPIIRGLLHDKFIIKLRKDYYIRFHIQFKIIRPKGLEPQSIRIFLSSNPLCFNFNNEKREIYNEIAETRWLPKNGRKVSPIFSLNPYLYFHEFAIPINFQTQFLNIVGAIKDWDFKIKKLYSK
ncbi:MAG: hypothetical protein ACFFG0_28510 [Candidatus Thorarchaeota archaeon]